MKTVNIKKLLSVMLCALLVFASLPLTMLASAEDSFEGYYEANIKNLTSASNALSSVDTALGLYAALDDTAKANAETQYKHIANMLDNYFISNSSVTYDSSALADYQNIGTYFKNNIFVETSNSRNNKVTDPAKFDSTKAQSVTVAFKYAELNSAGTAYKTSTGFNILPVVGAIDELTVNENAAKLFTATTQAKKTVYVDGVQATTSGTVYGYRFSNGFKNTVDSSNQYFKDKTGFGGIDTIFGSYSSAASLFVKNEATKQYNLPADRIVFDFNYTTETGTDSLNYKYLKIIFSNFTVWVEKDGSGTANSYDEGTDIKLCDYKNNSLTYRYGEETAPLPFFSTDDASLDSMLYFKSTAPVEQTFGDKYADVLAGTVTDAEKVLDMYAEYLTLGADEAASYTAKAEAAVTNAGLRPTAGGATLSVSADTHIGFYVTKPTASVSNTVGAVVSTYNYMVENGIDVLTSGMNDNGVLKETPVTNSSCDDNELMLAVTNLYGASNNWGNWIVVRYYAVYNVDGKDVVIYSTGANANNPTTATEVSTDGVAIRSINYLIKSIAGEIAKNVDTKGTTTGEEYVDINGITQTTYTQKTLADAYAANNNSTLYNTALDTLYFLMAYKGAL